MLVSFWHDFGMIAVAIIVVLLLLLLLLLLPCDAVPVVLEYVRHQLAALAALAGIIVYFAQPVKDE